jgi:formylglycine-generating enzyme required for sulfatase activity
MHQTPDRTRFAARPISRAPWMAALMALASLRCNALVDFSDCATDRDCRLGERCNASKKYCEVPAAELCNGLDDDHDGVSDADEDFGACEVERRPGMCRDGRRRCVSNRLQCVQRTTPSPTEVCFNGLDDDCNGTVDDGANCVVNFPRSTMVRVGSDNAGDGEGDDAPAHNVCIAPFSLDKHEVSNRAFLNWLNSLDASRFMVARPPAPLNRTRTYGTFVLYNDSTTATPNWVPLVLLPQPSDPGYAQSIRRRGTLFETLAAEQDTLPVVFATWLAADRYCRWAGKHLPTEAEFLRAMQGDGAMRTYPWGNDAPTCARANVAAGMNRAPCVGRPLPVASLDTGATPEGVFHLYGNVDEWMWDYLDDSPNHDRNNYYMSRAPTAWCTDFPDGPLGPSMGRPINEPGSTTIDRCTNCRFSRGRRFSSDDPRPLIRKWMDADNADPGIGFRCANGGATR